jgi:hypothetical protein
MLDEKKREAAESIFRDDPSRGTDVRNALSQEAARRAALLDNMYRLRALRLANLRQHSNSSE